MQTQAPRNTAPLTRVEAATELLARRKARRSLLAFMQYAWWGAQDFIVGLHTQTICDRIDRAIDDFRAGKSSFLIFTVPFRHGKSDIVSRALPAYFMGCCSEINPDIVSTGYGADLVQGFSRQSKRILESPQYRAVFPHVRLSSEKRTDAKWKVEYFRNGIWVQSSGEVTVTGLGGALTGAGYHLGTLDDYCKSREEAESERYREKTWDSTTNEFMTRRAPVSITVITATPWHVDDVIGRAKKAQAENPDFPRFEVYSFPARGPANLNGKIVSYESEYLFEDRFDKQWYRSEYATLGAYGAAGLLDCDPTVRAGNMFNVDRVQIHNELGEFPDTRYVRFWDLASTAKEVAKSDPDYTAGVKVGVTYAEGNGAGPIPHLWIPDIVIGQWAAPRRDKIIRATADTDGPEVTVLIEQVAGYKDTVETIKAALAGLRVVRGVPVSTDKVVRAAPVEVLFDTLPPGPMRVHILRAPWNDLFFKHHREFPFGIHDDVVDGVSGGYRYVVKHRGAQTNTLAGVGIF